MVTSPVSVVIPTHNRARLVRRAVESALLAVRPEDEVIVVDDGSTDGTAAVLAEHQALIRYVPSSHVGPGAIRNLGIREARHPVVAFLDSDDVWMPDKLELQRAVLEASRDAVLCFSDFAHRGRGVEVRRYLARWHHDPRSWDEILGPGVPFSSFASLPPGRADFPVHIGDLYPTAILGAYVCTSTALVRRDLAGDALRFAEDVFKYEDWECFARVAKMGPAAYLDCETQWNCHHEGPRLSAASGLDDTTARLIVLERVWGLDPSFLALHGDLFQRVVASHRLARARELLAMGRMKEARAELRRLLRAPVAHRLLATLPGPFARMVYGVHRRLSGRRRGAGNEAHAGR